MSKLIVCCLAKNEASRFWRSALEAWWQFADDIIVLDDGSTDGTDVIAVEARALIIARETLTSAWGNEAPARGQLWALALEKAEPGDWIFVLDADMTPARDPKPLLEANADAIAFKLYDLWTPSTYRSDHFWKGHLFPRVWLVKRPEEPAEGWKWPERGIHCGHFPRNLAFQKRPMAAPEDYSLLHYAYSTPELRSQKLDQYLAVHDQLSDFELRHALSITDAEPQLEPLPFEPQYRLEIANK